MAQATKKKTVAKKQTKTKAPAKAAAPLKSKAPAKAAAPLKSKAPAKAAVNAKNSVQAKTSELTQELRQTATKISTISAKKEIRVRHILWQCLKLFGAALFISCLVLSFVVYQANVKQIADLQKQQELLQQQLENNKIIYVFNLEKVVSSSDLVSIQKEFEEETEKLAKEVEAAKKKISGLKKSKVNEDFSDVYMKSLILKRDELVEKHQKQMSDVTLNINKALAEVAKEKGAAAVFNYKSVAVMSTNVVDISDEVIAKINSLLHEEKNQ